MSVLPFDLPGDALAPAPPPAPHVAATLLHESRWARVWHGDALDVLPALPTETYGVAVLDPPYGKDHQSNRRQEKFDRIENDSPTPADRDKVRRILEHCVRLVGQHRHLYVFGPDDWVEGLLVAEPAELIWDKGAMGSGDVTSPWGTSHERITFAQSKHRHAGERGKSNVPARMRKGSVLSYPRVTGQKLLHPHQKPVPLLRELIESSSRQGERVLDACAGVGSTGVAAILAGRPVDLIEMTGPYAELCVERVQAAERLAEQLAGI
jgi:DNA modification methylase